MDQTYSEPDQQYTVLNHSWFHPWKGKEISCEYRFRQPTQPEVNRYTKEAGKGSTVTATQNILTALVHEDDKPQLLADLKEYPALGPALGNWVLKSSGFSDLGN